MKTVAQLIDELFWTHPKENGEEYTHREVCAALKGAIEPSHLSKLRSGAIKNPSRETLLALCTFFRVPASYFFPELDALDQGPVGKQEDALALALRSSQLSPAVLKKLRELIQVLENEQS